MIDGSDIKLFILFLEWELFCLLLGLLGLVLHGLILNGMFGHPRELQGSLLAVFVESPLIYISVIYLFIVMIC